MDGKPWLDDALLELRRLKRQAEKALAQVGDDDFFRVLDPESNSLAILVKHLTGNLRSRWTDFLTSDGEKPDRNRDSEFVIEPADTRAALMERWERGWKYLFDALEPLGEDDLMRTVQIRGEPHTIVQAVNRQLSHYAAHIGQMVFLAKHLAGAHWKTLSVPRGQSEQFNQKMKEKLAARLESGPGPLTHQR
ncbi:MAG TPA: DUF1572 family protein [Candidatus Acidoferrales bacterium]|nr:DUF1572 family protein [Candidatus Acidoferrales bacterium]